MSAEEYNREMDDAIRSKGIFTSAMLRDFDKAYNQDSASGAIWLIGKLKLGKEVLLSTGRIGVGDDKRVVLSSVQSFDKWVQERYPDYAGDL